MDKSNVKKQISIFELLKNNNVYGKSYNTLPYLPSQFSNKDKFESYDLREYNNDIKKYGLKKTWELISNYVLNFDVSNEFLDINNFAELYEIGLSIVDKNKKKANGQYYTPHDVATVMSNWLKNTTGYNICDVACGTGNLMLSYLDLLERKEATKLILEGRIYLLDIDGTALDICKTIFIKKFGIDLVQHINFIECDFLDKNIILPDNCKVIANPPYASIDSIPSNWNKTEIAISTKQLYAMFMEKILLQSNSSVIITPYSFISSNKFYPLRKLMNNYEGYIISFDNVPGNIFNGKKHGVFNSNTANSVRASITVTSNKEISKGFALTPLIRFKNKERKELLISEVLENFIYEKKQLVSINNNMYYKCDKRLSSIFNIWIEKSQERIKDFINKDGQYILAIPNTCRYYTSASNGKMNRSGQITISLQNEDVYNYIFCVLNSSFAYWYWRLYDGGITFTKGLLLNIPIFFDLLNMEDKTFFKNIAEDMINNAAKYVIKKNNKGIQENIKYPRIFRDKINRRLLDILKIECDEKIFDIIHSNTALEINI